MYKLINKQTGESHLCEKVVIDGFDYYTTYPEKCCIQKEGKTLMNKGCMERNHCEGFVATNNPNIDCPKVVDEVEKLAKEHCEYWEFDRLLGSGSNGLAHDSFVFGYNKSQETHPFSEEDIIEFADWKDKNIQELNYSMLHNTKELLQLWKEQKPKTIYYE